MEVVGLYETVRRAVQQERAQLIEPAPDPVPIVERRPLPAWAFLPFGTPQFAQKQWGRGAMHATLQAAALTASIGLHVHLKSKNDFSLERGPYQQQRYLLQWPTTFAFYGLWIGSAVDASISFRKHQSAPRIQPSQTPEGGAALRIQGTW
jgi:hypothetical protein